MPRTIGEIADEIARTNVTLAKLGAELILASTGQMSPEDIAETREIASRYAPTRPPRAVVEQPSERPTPPPPNRAAV